jgi:MFS family permease
VLAAFYYGYICTQIPGAFLTTKYGGGVVLLCAVFMWSLFTVLTPPLSGVSFTMLLLCRVLMGLAEGVTMPAVHHLTAEWIPSQERSRAVTFAYSGQFVGMVLALLCSPLAAYDWPLLFYLFGVAGFLWCAACLRYGAGAPEVHPRVSRAEREFILLHRSREDEQAAAQVDADSPVLPTAKARLPERPLDWKDFFRESAFIAVVVAHVCHNYGFYLLLRWVGSARERRNASWAPHGNVCGCVRASVYVQNMCMYTYTSVRLYPSCMVVRVCAWFAVPVRACFGAPEC